MSATSQRYLLDTNILADLIKNPGAAVTYGLLKLYAPDWPRLIRFIVLLTGACSSAFIFARLALVLRAAVATAITVATLGGIGYLMWKVL